MPTTIETGARIVTLINVFTVEPGRQDDLVRELEDVTEHFMKKAPGFISASIHRGLDGQHVANYGQWESMEALDAMRRNPDAQATMKKAAAIGTPAAYLYTVESVHHRSSE
ncbi:MAG: antibiotic biosynthesis monooxygenase [Thermoplasmata archaeon]|nr:antibiotic biosynthesis monooxygenase [Thermoplasmata archaeon]